MADQLSNDEVNAVVQEWGGDYLPADENPEVNEVTIAIPDEESVEKVAKSTTPTGEEEAAEGEADADKPKEEEKVEEPAAEEVKVEEPEPDAETRKRLLMIERREAKFLAKERETKGAIESQIAKLERVYEDLEQREAALTKISEDRKAQYQQDPLKLLSDHGVSFAALAAANLRHNGLPVPRELEEQIAKLPKPEPKPALSVDEIAEVVDAKVSKILERLEQREQQSEQQRMAAIEHQDRARAFQFVETHADSYPFLAAFTTDPEDVAEQMIAARDTIYRATGRYGTIADAANYIESRLAERFQPILERQARPKGQPNVGSGSQRPSVEDRGAVTLSQDSGTQKVSSTPQNMEEAYEAAWQNALGQYHGG